MTGLSGKHVEEHSFGFRAEVPSQEVEHQGMFAALLVVGEVAEDLRVVNA